MCFSRLNAAKGAQLVGILEFFALIIGNLQTAHIAINDGYVFYTDYFLGKGVEISVGCLILSAVSSLVIGFMLYGVRRKISRLVLPHLIWQIVILILVGGVMGFTWLILYRKMKVEFGSVMVLETHFIVLFLLELWWFTIVANCYRTFRAREVRSSKTPAGISPINSSSTLAHFSDDSDNECPASRMEEFYPIFSPQANPRAARRHTHSCVEQESSFCESETEAFCLRNGLKQMIGGPMGYSSISKSPPDSTQIPECSFRSYSCDQNLLTPSPTTRF